MCKELSNVLKAGYVVDDHYAVRTTENNAAIFAFNAKIANYLLYTKASEQEKKNNKYVPFEEIIDGVEENNRINDAKWKDWTKNCYPEEVYGHLLPELQQIGRVLLALLAETDGEDKELCIRVMNHLEDLVLKKHYTNYMHALKTSKKN